MNTDLDPTGFHPVQITPLPIFRQDTPGYTLFYSPGYVVLVSPDRSQQFENALRENKTGNPTIEALCSHARTAILTRQNILQQLYEPVCLTVYLNEICNLDCAYCFSDPGKSEGSPLDQETILQGSEMVIQNCRKCGCAFVAVFHGGGEPSLDIRLENIVDMQKAMSAEAGVKMFGYIATNGVMSAEKATSIASRFDLIGLSCDGPEDIQAVQRKLKTGGNSLPYVERTAGIIHAAGKPLHVRVTITPTTIHRQVEITQYVCQTLRPQEIHVEAVYSGGRARVEDCLREEQAAEFIQEFLAAHREASQYHTKYVMSGSRPGTIHGPYCQVLRDVLHLVGGNAASACFKVNNRSQAKSSSLMIGECDSTGIFKLDYERIYRLRQDLSTIPSDCETCFNRFHCTRDCPNTCLLETHSRTGSFGCQVNRLLSTTFINETAQALIDSMQMNNGIAGKELENIL